MKPTSETQQELVHQILDVARGKVQSTDDCFEVRSILNVYLDRLYGQDSPNIGHLRTLRQLQLVFQILRKKLAQYEAETCEYCMMMIDIEIDMVNRRLCDPQEAVTGVREKTPAGPVLAWKGSVSQLLEMVCALFSTGLMTQKDGAPLNFIQTVKAFESFFGVKIHEPYKRRGILFERKRNITSFLDYLKRAYQQTVKASVD